MNHEKNSEPQLPTRENLPWKRNHPTTVGTWRYFFLPPADGAFFAPCWWGCADECKNFKHQLRKNIKAEKMLMIMVRNQRKKKFVSCKLQPETEAVTICFHLIYTPLQEEAKNNFSRPVHPMFMPFTHANPEIPPDSAFFLALIKFSTEIFCAGETKRCSICATFRRSYISVLHRMTHN